MPKSDLICYIILAFAALLSFKTGKLSAVAALTGLLVALLIYQGSGYTGIAMLALFFIAGSWATSWQYQQKVLLGAAEQRHGRRTPGQVLANSGVAAITGLVCRLDPNLSAMLQLMMAGSLAAATADTLSSELGTLYGRRFYHILSLRPGQRGLDGVISLEGTLIGIIGSALVALVYALGHRWGWPVLWVIIAGTAGNLADSVLGATLERKGMIGNNLVNFLNTLTGALTIWLLSAL
ncbi:hypothetical protein BEL04_17525 [Mucilaginibacter sp. PPCGB 2223]|uniref:DUF92 domain-containing protein n=1 Tax=Mucilaginibacter sp. PPCGB 2223 TaxID=1886027 RepID=UPI000826869D|nr:DUF92 domain-containing protein [Mucilaginibacter sp. PPCGB 2223]OCX51812.1 hypothetical protein BEL04_17525 [Mucilaginibacter sp. PPCGB 2223]